jgi:hypothetical protein
MRIILGVLFIIAAAVLTTLNARAGKDDGVLFTALIDPKDQDCHGAKLDTENSGLFREGDKYRIKIYFVCGVEV